MSVSFTTINGIKTATFTGTETLVNARVLLDGANAAIIAGYISIFVLTLTAF